MAKKKSDEKANPPPQSDNEEQNFDEEPDFDDPEGFVDDITDEGRLFGAKGRAGHMRQQCLFPLSKCYKYVLSCKFVSSQHGLHFVVL